MDFLTAQKLVSRNDITFFRTLEDPSSIIKLQHVKSGDSILHTCCRLGSSDILTFLIADSGADLDLELSNKDGKRPLHDAAQYSQEECLNVLLSNGADPNALKRSDWTPLMLACTKQSFEAVRLLLDAGADPFLRNKDGWNSFHLASRVGNFPILSCLLARHPQVWDTTSNNMRTPLHTAALHGHKEAVCWMLKQCDYQSDEVDSCDVTPFIDSLRGGNVDTARALVAVHKINVSHADKTGRTAIHHAAQSGQRSSINYLVCELGVSVNTSSPGAAETALHAAAKDGQTDIVKYLLQLGADSKAVDKHGRTASDVALLCRHLDCVNILQDHLNTGKVP